MPPRPHRICPVVLCLATAIAACSCRAGHGSSDSPASGAGVAASSSTASDAGQSPPREAPTAPALTASATGAAPAAGFHCFSWVHGPESSTDCYPDRAECERERRAMTEGARETTECKKADHVSCVRLSRPPSTTEIERCFADAGACARYRAFVQGNGHKVTACAER
jgi:hypothetical protein